MATSQKPSAIPVQNFVANPSYHYTPLVKPPPVLTNHTTPTLNQPLVSRGVDKRYPTPTNGVPKPSTSPIPMSPKYLINPVQPFPQLPLPSKLPVASSTVSRQSSRQRTVEKAMRARLYLLEQPGPNTFLVTGDSNESRFRVIVGTQVSSLMGTLTICLLWHCSVWLVNCCPLVHTLCDYHKICNIKHYLFV